MRQLSRRQRRAAIVLAIVAVMFCAFDLVGAPFEGARGGVNGYLGALYRGTDSVIGPARRFVQNVPQANSNEQTIAKLRRQVADLQRAQAAHAQDQATSTRLAELQLQSTRGGYSVLPARVTAIGPDGGFDWTVVLDAGSDDGIKVNQTVIAGPDLVGRVLRVSSSSATVLLAADPRSGVGARSATSGQLGVVTGQGTRGFTYAPLDPSAAPTVGEQLVTGPAQATTYVAGLTIGTIKAVTTRPDGTSIADVTPAVTPTTLDLVGVILVGGEDTPRTPLTPTPGTTANAGSAPTTGATGR